VFGLATIIECDRVDPRMLQPGLCWDNPEACAAASRDLAARFVENFRQYASEVPEEVAAAGPSPE